MAYNLGLLFIFLSTFASLFTEKYQQTVSQSGYHYVVLAIGYRVTSQIRVQVVDSLWASLKKKADGVTTPEHRIPWTFPWRRPYLYRAFLVRSIRRRKAPLDHALYRSGHV